MIAFDVSKTRIPTLNNINLTKKFIKKPVKTKFMEKIFKRSKFINLKEQKVANHL